MEQKSEIVNLVTKNQLTYSDRQRLAKGNYSREMFDVNVELKPCPFCGHEPVVRHEKPRISNDEVIYIEWNISCKHCGNARVRSVGEHIISNRTGNFEKKTDYVCKNPEAPFEERRYGYVEIEGGFDECVERWNRRGE